MRGWGNCEIRRSRLMTLAVVNFVEDIVKEHIIKNQKNQKNIIKCLKNKIKGQKLIVKNIIKKPIANINSNLSSNLKSNILLK